MKKLFIILTVFLTAFTSLAQTVEPKMEFGNLSIIQKILLPKSC